MRVVSLVTADLLPQARVLARSLRAHGGGELEVVIVSAGRPELRDDESFSASMIDEVIELDVEQAIASHDLDLLVVRLVPLVLAARCRTGTTPVLHLPATAWVLAPLDPIVAELARSEVALFARALEDPPDDGLAPDHIGRQTASRIAPLVIGVDGSERAVTFLAWWREQLTEVLGPLAGTRFGGVRERRRWLARYLELAPSRFGTAVIEDPGCYVSSWNLPEHRLGQGVGGPELDEHQPVRILDLEGYEPDRPWRLGPRVERVRLSGEPVLRELLERYGGELREAGWRHLGLREHIGRELRDGLVFDERLSVLLGQAHALGLRFGDVFAAEGARAFVAWLRSAAPAGGRHGVSRYLYRVYQERVDIPLAYPDLDGADGPGFIGWCWAFGQREMGIPPALLPDKPAQIDMPDPRVPGIAVRVTGYLSHTLGLGSAARGYVQALQAAGVPVATAAVPLQHGNGEPILDGGYGRHAFQETGLGERHAMEIVAVNHEELPALVRRLGPGYFHGPRIGIWAWETNRIPERWDEAFGLLDEIWVNSRYMAQNIGRGAPVPVLAYPPAVHAPATDAPHRLGLPDGFLFAFTFDYLSTIQRKNPVGLVRAFQRAFAPGEGPQLLLKTINGPRRPLAEEELRLACEGRPDIHVVDRSLSGVELQGLIAGCDCYVSLHRAEGYGLTLAEAMAIGKPVIATGYSGNLDFMTPFNSLLVDFAITRVGGEVEIYPADGEWAEPSIEHAAELMRLVVERPEHARRLGERARRDIAEQLSPQVCGSAMRERLERLARRR
jgi:glycosyltransferase involved in cell wall biosynthesis